MCGGSSEVGLFSRLSRNACTRKTRTRAPAATPSSLSRFAEGIAAHFNIRSLARYGEAHHGDQPAHAAAPIREQVDILQLPLDRTRHGTTVQPNRHDENLIQGNLPGTVQCVPNLCLKSAFLADGVPGITGHKEIRRLDGGFDGPRPVLPGQELADVHPGAEAGSFQSVADPLGVLRILFNVGDEYLRKPARLKAEPIDSVW